MARFRLHTRRFLVRGHPSVAISDEVPALPEQIDARRHDTEQDNDTTEAVGEPSERGSPVESVRAVRTLRGLAHRVPTRRSELDARTNAVRKEADVDELRV